MSAWEGEQVCSVSIAAATVMAEVWRWPQSVSSSTLRNASTGLAAPFSCGVIWSMTSCRAVGKE